MKKNKKAVNEIFLDQWHRFIQTQPFINSIIVVQNSIPETLMRNIFSETSEKRFLIIELREEAGSKNLRAKQRYKTYIHHINTINLNQQNTAGKLPLISKKCHFLGLHTAKKEAFDLLPFADWEYALYNRKLSFSEEEFFRTIISAKIGADLNTFKEYIGLMRNIYLEEQDENAEPCLLCIQDKASGILFIQADSMNKLISMASAALMQRGTSS